MILNKIVSNYCIAKSDSTWKQWADIVKWVQGCSQLEERRTLMYWLVLRTL